MSVAAKPISRETHRPFVAGIEMPEFRRIAVEPLSGAAGAEISGVDLKRPLDDATLEEIRLAFDHFLVLVFRDQDLTIEEHKRFSDYFGPITELPQAPLHPGYSDVQEVRREADEPETVIVGQRFHSDSPFLARPPLGIAMRALEVPRFGGDTAFSNMHLAYEGLSDGLKQTLDGLKIVYSLKAVMDRNALKSKKDQFRSREGHGFKPEELENAHPVVRTHPRTGRKALYCVPGYAQRFEGWTEEESQPLIGYLGRLAYSPAYQCRVHWQKNTIIIWDNRFLQHAGVHDYSGERRHLIRTTILGERPA
jgi:taurine dioxygenase